MRRMNGLIYDYLKEKLSKATNSTEYGIMLYEAEMELDKIKREYSKTWRYCLGCKGTVKRSELYEDDFKGRVVLRCCNCDAIVEFPEFDAYLI
jgi:hypothetical protein